jgi:hypothetical protein
MKHASPHFAKKPTETKPELSACSSFQMTVAPGLITLTSGCSKNVKTELFHRLKNPFYPILLQSPFFPTPMGNLPQLMAYRIMPGGFYTNSRLSYELLDLI